MTELDMVLEQRAAELEMWLESKEAIPFWGDLGVILLIVIGGWLAFRLLGDLFIWSSKTWKRLLLAPLGLFVAVVGVWVLLQLAGLWTAFQWPYDVMETVGATLAEVAGR